MLYTLEDVKANVRNRDGKRVFYLGSDHRLTPGARDWLLGERIEILPAGQAKSEVFSLLYGGYLEEKPENMTHLHGNVLVPKGHPRILFRGAVDTLEAELILAQLVLEKSAAAKVGEILGFVRNLIRCDVLGEPVKSISLCGLSDEQIRQRSHRPQDFYGKAHFMPEASDGPAMARLNRARCAAREAELRAIDAFSDRDGLLVREDIPRALNRVSSMLYIIMVEIKEK